MSSLRSTDRKGLGFLNRDRSHTQDTPPAWILTTMMMMIASSGGWPSRRGSRHQHQKGNPTPQLLSDGRSCVARAIGCDLVGLSEAWLLRPNVSSAIATRQCRTPRFDSPCRVLPSRGGQSPRLQYAPCTPNPSTLPLTTWRSNASHTYTGKWPIDSGPAAAESTRAPPAAPYGQQSSFLARCGAYFCQSIDPSVCARSVWVARWSRRLDAQECEERTVICCTCSLPPSAAPRRRPGGGIMPLVVASKQAPSLTHKPRPLYTQTRTD